MTILRPSRSFSRISSIAARAWVLADAAGWNRKSNRTLDGIPRVTSCPRRNLRFHRVLDVRLFTTLQITVYPREHLAPLRFEGSFIESQVIAE